jgi:integral membrane protein (TIGR01906 family)
MKKITQSIVPRSLVILFSLALGFAVVYAAFLSVFHYLPSPNQDLLEQDVAIRSYVSGPLFAENQLTFLSPTEFSHMIDVKRLFDIAFITYLVSLGIVIGTVAVFLYGKLWERFDELLSRSLRATGWALLALCFVLGLAALLNFDKFWILFHLILFPQGNWGFASDSVLIQLYPSQFFERFTLYLGLLVLSFAIVALALSYFLDHMRRAQQHFK